MSLSHAPPVVAVLIERLLEMSGQIHTKDNWMFLEIQNE